MITTHYVTYSYFGPTSGPPPIRAPAPERTYATPHAATHVHDRSHAHASRTRADTNRTHRQLVTARRYTGLTVTFSRPAESRLDTHTASEVEHTRSVLRSAVGRFSLDPAHHPCHAGAGAGCALSRPSWTASLAQRLRFCDNQGHFATPAASSAHVGQSTTSPHHPRHPRPCHRPWRRLRRRLEPHQPSGLIRIGRARAIGRCAAEPPNACESVTNSGQKAGAPQAGMHGIPRPGRWRPRHRWR